MRRRWTTWVAWGGWLFFIALTAATILLDETQTTQSDAGETLVGDLSLILAFASFATVGALVASRQPRNAVGWCLLGSPILAMTAGFSQELASRDADPGTLALFGDWLVTWTWYPAIGLIAVVVLLFPNGSLPGRRWRFILWPLVAAMSVVTVGFALYPGPVDQTDHSTAPDNPIGIEAMKRPLDLLLAVVGPILGLLIGASALSMVIRFRRSRGDERQQLKWMTFAVVTAVVVDVITIVVGTGFLGDAAFGFSIALIPIAAGIAVLKYRLYDIDRVISKTLVYGSVTALLAAGYLGLVLAGQWLFSSFAGGSNLVIAASTLVVAALFLPLRGRIQRFVDRRFYRRRYDAQRTLEAFGARLREQVELETLTSELDGVVRETMQPSSASVWLRAGVRS